MPGPEGPVPYTLILGRHRMTSGDEFARIRDLAARLGIPSEQVEQYIKELHRAGIEYSEELRPQSVPQPAPAEPN